MPRNTALDLYHSFAAPPPSPARNWYALTGVMIGALELPAYARAMRVRVGSTATPPVILVVVPLSEDSDAATQTITVDATETLAFGVRRVVSVNGGTSIPTGVEIQMVTA
jgi:hypothetical protein